MMKKLSAVVITFFFTFIAPVSALSADRFLAKSMVNGSNIYFDGFEVEYSNYFTVRDIAALLKGTKGEFSVETSDNTVILTKGEPYEPMGFEFFKSMGKKQQNSYYGNLLLVCGDDTLDVEAHVINERYYIKLRDILTVLDYDVSWDKETHTISISDDTEKFLDISLQEPALYDISKPMVALTFDDGPSVNTPHILDTLNKYDASATFFVVGINAARYGDILRNINISGCQIGNHTYNHSNLAQISDEKIKKEVGSVQNVLYEAVGVYPTYLRPPYGSYNSRVKNAIDLKMINWSVDTRDWESRNSERIYSNVIKNLKDGNVILMHDLYGTTASAVDKIVPELKRRGFQMVTLEQLYEARGELSGMIK